MLIREGDYRAVMDYLVSQRWEGNEFVAFLNDGAAVNNEDLFCFATPYEAREFCYENSTDLDVYECMGIRSVYRTMGDALSDPALYITRNGLIDISAMASAREERMEKATLNDQNYKAMNMKNLEFLQDQVKYTGFGEGLSNDVKAQIGKGGEEFKLQHSTKFGNDTVDATLNFSKSKQSEMYFFNSYNVSLQKEGNAEKLEQTFYINKGQNITLKEAYNLMEGRAVNKDLTNKEGEKYNVWVQIDFKNSDENGNFRLKKFSENYGYDLEAAVSKHPVKELQRDCYKESLMDSLKKGNVQSVTFQVEGSDQKHFIEANPKYKTINVYDADMQKLGNREAKSEKQAESTSQSAKKSEKKEISEAEAPAESQKTSRKRGQKV